MKQEVKINKDPGCHLKISGLKKTCALIAVFGILVFLSTIGLQPLSASESIINCDAHSGICSQAIRNLTVSLEISPRPVKAMQELVFKVSISVPPSPENPYIDLGMPGMKMGPNRVLLKSTDPGFYEGKGVIVRCPSGRRTWFANVTIPEFGEVKFIFDVIY
jgi:hypothetical protein